MREPQDRVDHATALAGMHGRAWIVDLETMRRRLGFEVSADCTGVCWVIEAPSAHPIWHSYMLTLISLRPMPGIETVFHLDGATHEFWLYALEPDAPRQSIIAGMENSLSRWWLNPCNFAAQFIAPSDKEALHRIRSAVARICEGQLSPDTDYIRHWMYLFGDNMVKDKGRAGETRIVLDLGGPKKTEIVIPAKPGPQDHH